MLGEIAFQRHGAPFDRGVALRRADRMLIDVVEVAGELIDHRLRQDKM